MDTNYFLKLFLSINLTKAAAVVLREISRRMYSNETFSIYQFDLAQPFAILVPSIPITVRQLCESDIPRLLSLNEPDSDFMDLRNRLERLLLIRASIPTCYVGVTNGNHPCVMCWLINHTSNDKLQSHFRGGLMNLKQGEVLCENIFTHRSYRNNQLMQYLTLKLFEKAARDGAQKAFAYISTANIASLKVSKQIGWKPCGVKKSVGGCSNGRLSLISLTIKKSLSDEARQRPVIPAFARYCRSLVVPPFIRALCRLNIERKSARLYGYSSEMI
jgi:hypothetical protein